MDWEKGLTLSATPPKEPEPRLPPIEALVPDWAKQPLTRHVKHAKKGEKSHEIFRDCLVIIETTLADFRQKNPLLMPALTARVMWWEFLWRKAGGEAEAKTATYKEQLRPFRREGYITKALYDSHQTVTDARALLDEWDRLVKKRESDGHEPPGPDAHFNAIRAAHFLEYTINLVVSVHRKID